ncbi:sulfatase family protein [Aureliella helgolandensis]|uniref:Arylsulfatase n=1 Tax=Aureliella helgolandensis TaxID=2527968 RepID=A0A518G8Z7_9BACT|nr:arylsulfatase [Aureliella helgolandensis]QDV25074.1 Arylsulfatase [Aureliella helgolandensis]
MHDAPHDFLSRALSNAYQGALGGLAEASRQGNSQHWLLATIVGLLGINCLSTIAAERPNIIVLYTDDQGYGDASCLNPQAKFETPNLDRLAHEGIRFTNGHSADSVCSPSRYGLLTGRYCWRTTLKTGVLEAEAECLIEDGRETLATLLRRQGYTTSMVGKWHLGMQFPGDFAARDWSGPVRDMPLDKGFDYFFGIPASLNYGVLAWFEGRHAATPPTQFTAKKPNSRHVDYRIAPPYESTPAETKRLHGKAAIEVAADFVDNQCLTRFTDRAIQWMTRHISSQPAPAPFFLYLPFTSPHYPVCPSPEFWGQGECGGYGEFVIETDYHVGRILNYLESAGIDDNTLIVFTSDNGPETSWKQRAKKFDHASNGSFRGGKRDIYEGGHRVPFFVRWPSGIAQPGREWSRPVGQVDLLATIAELLQVELDSNAAEDSCSFAPVLTSPTTNLERLPLINHAMNGRFSITKGDWKLVLPHKDLPAELFDLANDAGEQEDLLADASGEAHQERVAHLTRLMTEIVVNGRTTPGLSQPNDTGYWNDLSWLPQSEYESLTQQD